MKKLYSLIKACMTSDMSLFKIKTNKKNKSALLIPLLIASYLMFMIWGLANTFFEKVDGLNIANILLSLFVFGTSFMTIMEGIYKSGSLIFNCKDDQLLLSLPISRRTVLFIRLFKFYVFELIFNTVFLLPIMIAYIRWASVTWTYYLTSFIMLLLLPIIPIVISCIIGVIISSLSSRFKYKNAAQIIISMIFVLLIMFGSWNMDGVINYIVEHATSMNDLVTKIYYPAGMYAKLVTDFNVVDLLVLILVHVVISVITILVLGKFYFKINSRLKRVKTTSNSKKLNNENYLIKAKSPIKSLIGKEITTFFKTPVFIINAGFALVLYLILAIMILFKSDAMISAISGSETILNLSVEEIMNNISLIVFILILFTSFMTSITNSIISLEGKNINILKSLPISTKTILMGKILAALLITTPVLLVGDILLIVKFKISIIEAILLLLISIVVPLISHFIGIIINLKYPKLEWESETDVVKQSTSSFLSVMLGMILLIASMTLIMPFLGNINSTLILLIALIIYSIIDLLLYFYVAKRSVKEFDKLSV